MGVEITKVERCKKASRTKLKGVQITKITTCNQGNQVGLSYRRLWARHCSLASNKAKEQCNNVATLSEKL